MSRFKLGFGWWVGGDRRPQRRTPPRSREGYICMVPRHIVCVCVWSHVWAGTERQKTCFLLLFCICFAARAMMLSPFVLFYPRVQIYIYIYIYARPRLGDSTTGPAKRTRLQQSVLFLVVFYLLSRSLHGWRGLARIFGCFALQNHVGSPFCRCRKMHVHTCVLAVRYTIVNEKKSMCLCWCVPAEKKKNKAHPFSRFSEGSRATVASSCLEPREKRPRMRCHGMVVGARHCANNEWEEREREHSCTLFCPSTGAFRRWTTN
jgi:hypothetical protein